MATEIQYIIPILRDSDKTWSKIHVLAQHSDCLYDQHGNLENCGFARVNNNWVGEFYIFQSLDKKVAEAFRDALISDPSLNVLPLRKVLYQK